MDAPADRLPGADAENLISDSDGLAAEVPAGAAGADSGAVGTARIDPDDEARIPSVSSQNDLPGVGTRDSDEARAASGSASRHTEDTDRDATEHVADEATGAPAPPPEDAGEPHVDADDPLAAFQPGVGRDAAASSRIAQSLPHPDEA